MDLKYQPNTFVLGLIYQGLDVASTSEARVDALADRSTIARTWDEEDR